MVNKELFRVKKVNMINSKRERKSLFIIYTDFESILVPENNGK